MPKYAQITHIAANVNFLQGTYSTPARKFGLLPELEACSQTTLLPDSSFVGVSNPG